MRLILGFEAPCPQRALMTGAREAAAETLGSLRPPGRGSGETDVASLLRVATPNQRAHDTRGELEPIVDHGVLMGAWQLWAGE